MKKLLAILLSVLLLMACVPLGAVSVAAAYTGTTGDCTWLLEHGHLTISGKGEMEDYSNLGTAPWGTTITSVTIGNGVTSIGNWAFFKCSSLTSVTIPDSVTSIGHWAFRNCDSLTSITIPDSVTSIGLYVFVSCKSLRSIVVDEDNPNYCSVDGVLFNKSKTELVQYPVGNTATHYTIPDSVTIIGDGSFWTCKLLTSVTIPDSVTSIEVSAFQDCASLTSVTIPDSVTSIGSQAFDNCYALTSVTIGNSVATIGIWAFEDCTSLTSVTIPDSVTSLGSCAFQNCTSLASVTIPDSVTSIGTSAFFNTAYYNNGANWTGGALYIGNHLICATQNFSGPCVVRSGTVTIHASAFADRDLTSVTIPDSVTTIGDYAFEDCDSLKTVIIGDTFTTIGDSVITIGSFAFHHCDSLTSVTIPRNVTTIGENAFNSCNRLTSVSYYGSEANKASISIGSGNDSLLNVTWRYYKPNLYGDLNSDDFVNNLDMALLQRYLNSWNVTITTITADVNDDDFINNLDLALLQRYINGWDVTFG